MNFNKLSASYTAPETAADSNETPSQAKREVIIIMLTDVSEEGLRNDARTNEPRPAEGRNWYVRLDVASFMIQEYHALLGMSSKNIGYFNISCPGRNF